MTRENDAERLGLGVWGWGRCLWDCLRQGWSAMEISISQALGM